MATKTSLIQLVNVGEDKSIHNLNPKTVGKGVSVERTNQKIPSSVTDVQTLCNALGKLAFNDKYTGITAADFAGGVITQELNITETGKIADARALKTLNDTLTTQGQQITQINNNYESLVDRVGKLEEGAGEDPGGGGTGGQVFDGATIGGSTNDNTAESDKVLQLTAPLTDSELMLDIADLEFGTYAIVLRAKVSSIANRNIATIKASSVVSGVATELRSVTINANMFKEAGKYQSIGYVVEYTGTKAALRNLRIELVAPSSAAGSGSPTFTIDYILVDRATPAIYEVGE